MIIFFLQVILFTYLISSTFTYTHVKDTKYAANEADHARNTSLAVSIITGTALLIINLFYYLRYIELYRATIIFIFVNLVAAILSLVAYVYLEKQRTSPPTYETKLNELRAASETQNEEAQKFSFWTGLVNIVILGLICAYLLGHAKLTEREFIRIEEPRLYNVSGKTSRGRIGHKLTLNERVNKNFLV